MKLFISYSRDDRAWVYEFWRALRDEGQYDAWIDRRLVPAQDWWGAILDNIEACDCFVYVMTPKAVESIYCRAELAYALALNKPVLPLMLKPCDYPAALGQRRVQYQLITDDMHMDRVLLRTGQGLIEVRIGLFQGKYTPPASPPPRPDLPTPERKPEQVSEVYLLAEEAAGANNISLAEKLFQQVMNADPQGWGVAAADRLADIRLERDRSRDYLVIVQLARNPAQVRGARAAAKAYIQKYGADYDPNDVLSALLAPPPTAPPRPEPERVSPAEPQPGWDRVALRPALGRLSLDELRSLAFDLKLEYEGVEKGELVRRIIASLEQRRQLDRLVVWLQEARPDIDPAQFLIDKPNVPAPAAQQPKASPGQIKTTPSTTPKPAASSITAPSSTTTPKPGGPALGDRITDADGVTMVYVPPGKFMMGSDDFDRTKPPHEVEIAQGFWLDLTPVTNAMYARFIKAGGYTNRDFWTEAGWQWAQKNKKTGPQDHKGFTDPEQPRVGVTWFEAHAYCRWRGGRLPTEAEWEWAARGPENRTYPWGNDFDPKRVIYSGNSGNKTAPVHATVRLDGASWVGALDMSGNVWEWVSSQYKSYPYRADDGRENQEDGEGRRALRGGSWSSNEDDLRAATRSYDDPALEYNNGGFRCARSS